MYRKFMLLAATAGAICCYGGSAEAKTTFLPDWQGAGLEGKSSNESNMDLNRDEKLCMEQNAEFKYYTSAQCPKYYALDETCDIDTHYLDCNPVRWCLENDYKVQSCSDPDKHLYNQCPNNYPYYQKCVCNSQFRYTSSNCNGQYYLAGSSCTDDRSSTKKYTQCICSPKSSETGCSCTTSCSDGCGGTRTCCTSCPPPPTPPSTSSGGSSVGGGGGGGGGGSGGGGGGSGPRYIWTSRVFKGNHICWESNAGNCGRSGMYAWVEDADQTCSNADTGEVMYTCTKSGYRTSRCYETMADCRANPGDASTHGSDSPGTSCPYPYTSCTYP